MGEEYFKLDSPRDLFPQHLDSEKSVLHLDLKEYFHAILTIRIVLKHSPPHCELLVLFNVVFLVLSQALETYQMPNEDLVNEMEECV